MRLSKHSEHLLPGLILKPKAACGLCAWQLRWPFTSGQACRNGFPHTVENGLCGSEKASWTEMGEAELLEILCLFPGNLLSPAPNWTFSPFMWHPQAIKDSSYSSGILIHSLNTSYFLWNNRLSESLFSAKPQAKRRAAAHQLLAAWLPALSRGSESNPQPGNQPCVSL